ncbi:DUF11 domain-containing protein [Comamonas piscis]|uniref:DUF11 domain-containing protein n=1 Tax=Comamonas piscis TaxID=1562974 RepID=A0A7G5EMF8_9BURK|nr:DUF11 domain-containing protein [Comamonas piscis]QMV75183.1 DUF11 domain-containing protein [Comamonas piscis]WSO33672.1 DUF11 domain-containing protein [Comamonas piscis]
MLVIQMQDASINAANSSAYGSGGTGGTGGQGSTNVNNSGLYEFVRVVSVSGSTVTFTPALTNNYRNAATNATSGQKTYQVVRVPQYTSASVSGVTAPAWNGATGGVVAIDARDTLTLNGATVENQANRAIFLAGKGFRGAAANSAATLGSRDDWMGTYAAAGGGGGKGEGIAGTPRFMASKGTAYGAKLTNAVLNGGITQLDNVEEGYPGGSRARGAPGNAGGGGADGAAAGVNNNNYNSGGGGGGNYAAGGVGGRPWAFPLVDSGGRGGGGYVGTTAFNRIFLGGGGGAGSTNNGTADNAAYSNNGIACSDGDGRCSSGASGGGIVILRAQNVTGTGVIDVRGANGYNVLNDAAGGGGAGGSVVIHTLDGGSAAIDASGGDGGNAWAGNQTNTANRHGPGGGGGGGFIAFSPSNMAVSTTISGGTPGYTTNGTTDNYGAFGNQGGIAAFQSPNAPGTLLGAACAVDLRLTKSNGANIVNAGGTTTYTFTASNVGASASSGTITVVDKLPLGVTIPAASIPLTGANAANWSCSGAAGSRLITCTSSTAIAAGGSSVFGVTVNIGLQTTTGTIATNRAKIGGGGDPLNGTAPTEANVDACTGNQTPAGCALDVDAVNSPLLSLTNSDNTDVVLTGGTTTYALTVSNVGNAPTVNTITVVDVLPTGMSYGGATTFTSGGFSCTYTSGTTSFSCTRSTPIAAGDSAVISLPVSIASTAPSALVNLARVGGGSDSSKPNAPTVATTQTCSPAIASEIATGCAADTDSVKRVQLSLTKDDGRFGIYVGGTTTYAFQVSNTGDADSVGTINFRDVLPTPMNWPATLTKTGPNAADWTCTRASNTAVSCTSTTAIAAGGVSQFSLLANAGAMTSGDQYMNKAMVTGGADAVLGATAPTNAQVNTCTNNSIPAGCAVDLNTAQTPPTVRLTKAHSNPQSKAPGDTVAFTLTVANSATVEALANTVRVVDVFPTGLSNFTVTATQGIFSCAMGSGGDSNVLTCNNTGGALAASTSATIAVTATVSANTSTTLVNKAQVGTDNTDPTNSSYPTSTTVAACTAVNTPTAGCAIDSIPVVPSATLTVVASVASRINGTDQFTVAISNGPNATTSGTNASASTAAFAATPGTSFTLSETASGTTELARYTTTYACTNPTAGGTTVAPGTGTTLNVTPKAGDAITCTFTNTPIAPRLTLAKTIVSRASASDQFSVAISGGPTASTTGTGTTASTTAFTAAAGTSYTLSESATAGANLARYTSSYSCTNAGVAGTVMPSGTGTSFPLTPQAGDNISCTFSNSAIAPKLTVNTVVSGRILGTDQFTVGINNGGPSASTSGVQNTASAGPTTATAGTTYLLTQTAAGTPATNLARYTTTYACTNATAGGTSVGSGTGTSISVTPQAGDDISCTFTNTPIYPKLSVTKAASPTSFVVGASSQSYRITIAVTNGPTTAAISIADSLPTGVTLSGVPTVSGAATLSGCSTSGSSIGACQLASGLSDGSYVLTIPVSVASSATSTGAGNTANLGGGGDPTCTAAATTEACDPTTGVVTVKTPANVSLVKSGAATAVAGNSYVYTLALTNSGQTATASNVVVRDQLATGMVATAVTGANCGTLPSAAGALLTCTVADPIAADGGSASIQLTVTMPSGGGNVVNYAATHPSGSGNPGVNPGAACTNGTTVVCASSTTASSTPANVSLSKTGAATALTGSSYVYTLTLSNSGQLATGSNLVIKDKLPAGVVATAVSGATCGALPSSAAALLTCTVAGPLAAGATANVQLTVTLPGTGGTLVNYAATNPTGAGAPGVDPSASCVSSATTYCTSHSLSVNTPASLATTNVLTAVNGAAVPANYLAKPGDVLTYTVTVVNSGGTAGSTDVGQTVPAGTTYTGSGQGWGAGCTTAGTQCSQTVPVGANQSSTLTYTVTVASPGSTATIVDTATSSVGTCTTCQVTTGTQQADMDASISVSPGTTSATGVELTYTSICKNIGPQTALNAACTVTAPAGALTTCTPTSPAATLASGSSITCTTKLTPSVVGDYAVSVATSNTLYDAVPGNNSATATVKANTPAALRIVKSLAQVNGAAVPNNYVAKIGDTLTYAMLVTNTGGTAGTTVLTETVPDGTRFVGVSSNPSQGWSQAPQACAVAASTCTQSVSVPAQNAQGVAGQQTVQFTVEVLAPATSNGKITNTVSSDIAAACTSGTCAVETANAVADMQAQISSIPATAVVVGQSVTITGTCTNNGPANAVNASCAMTVNNAGTSIAGTCSANTNLAMGSSLSCTATFNAGQGAISATINTSTQSYESNTANNTDTKSTVGNTPASLATTNVLTAVNGSPVPAGYLAKPGDVLTYTVSVTNSGGTAGSTNVGHTVPAGTTYTGTGEGWSAGCAAAGTQCAQTVPVGAGETKTVQYTVTVANPGTTATIVDTATSSVGTCTTCQVTTDTQQADMAASVTVTPGAISTTGVELIYTSVCKNNGPQSALNAACVVTAPANAVTTCAPTTPAATLASGSSITCTTKLTPSTADDYAVSVVTSNDLYDKAPANNTANTSVKVNTPAALNIVKSLVQVNGLAVPQSYAAKIGDKLTYAMVVTNTGGTAGTTVLTETVPEGTKFVGGNAPDLTQGWSEVPQKCDAAGTSCEQSVNVPAQTAEGPGEKTVEFTVEVIAPATSNGKITNTVASDIAAACAGNACSVETDNAVADMQAQITSIPATAVVVGDSVTITGLCTNNGPASAASASCAMVVSNGGASITATCDAARTLAVGETLSCSATFTAAEGTISASINAAAQSYESNTANNTDSKSTVGNTAASLVTTNVLTAVNGAAVPANYLAKPGDVLTYTVTVVNSGGTAGSTDVGMTVPAGTTYTGTGQGWGAGCTAAGTQCAQTVPVAANQTSAVTYTVTVASPGTTATIVDTATSSVGTCTTCVVTTNAQSADMQATVTVTPGTTSTTGIELTYTAICKNNGPQAALNASCVVSAPAGASAAICTPTSPAATLASGDSISCVTKLTPSTAGDYAVSVTTGNTLYDVNTGNNTASTSVKVNTPADLRIVKSLVLVNGADVPANYAAKIGDKLTYAMLVTNAGGTSGTTVLTETVPEGTQFVGGIAPNESQGWSQVTQVCDAAGSTCTQSVTVAAQGADGVASEQTVQFTVEVVAPATTNGKITNTVLSDVAAACAGANCSVETANAVADMQAQITGIPASAVVVGDSVTITGVCTNNGPANAVNASCEMTVNNGGTSIPAICGANANLAVNDSISCSATFTAAEGTISASINAAAQSYESNTANNTDSKSTVGNTAASLVTTNVLTEVNGAAVPANYLAKPGDVLTYTVTVVNSGGTAGSTDVGMTVPAGTTYTGTGQGWGAGCTAAGTQCAQTVPVAANQTSTVTYTVTVASPGTTATIVDTATSSVGTCTTCVVTTNTQQADMVASVTVTPGTTSTTGIELTYTAICKNNGPQAALNASCVVSAPAGASAVVCTPTSPAATLASGDSISCVTKLTPSTAGDYAVSVTTGNTLYDVNTGNNTASTSVKVNTPADLRIVKSLALVNDAAVPANYAAKIGDKLTYAMLVTNAGGTSGTTVLTETVPEGTQFVGGIAPNESQGWSQVTQVCDAAGSTCTQSVTVAAQGADGVAGQQTVEFTVEVIAPATSNGKITNTVESSVGAACTSGTCSVETANAVADMQAQITGIPASAVVVGESVTITGVCTNNGPATAVNASCEMTVNNGGTSIPAICGANANLAVNDSISCSATFTAAEGTISASINAAAQSYESNTANNTDSKSTVGNTAASLVTTNVLTEVNGAAVPANYLAKPGDVLTYTVTVVNSGGTAGSTDVGMTVPAGTTYTGTGQGWGAGCTAAGTQCAQTVPVAANQTSAVTYTVTVASPGTTATIVDTATSSVGTCTTCVVTTNAQSADMQATVTVTPGTTSTTGIELTYTAICKNNGPQAALNASCVVNAPAGASAVVCTPTSPAASLASGDSISCVTKLTPSTAGDYALSVATSNDLYDATPANNTANTSVKVNTPAALNIVKSLVQVNGEDATAGYATKIGDKLTYAMVVTNTGGTSGTTILTETVPEGTQFVGGTAPNESQGWSQAPACGAAGSTCEQSVTVPAQSAQGAAGEQTVEFTVEVIAPATSNGKITNTVESSVGAACTSGTCSVETANAVADMQAQITGIPASAVVVGESVTITGVCTNNGPATAVNASCEMTVNNGGTSIPAICGANANLAVNDSISCSATFTAAEGTISASINAAAQSYESNTANNTDSKSTVGNTAASLVTTNVLTEVNGAAVPANYLAKPGDVLTYTVTVVNSGGTAGSTDVGMTVPAGTTYTGTGQGWGAGCTAAGTQCAQTVPVAANQTSAVTYTVTVASPGTTATIVDTATSSVGTCTTCVVTTNAQSADMQATVTVTPGTTSTTGIELTYTAICKNNGPQAALNASCVVTAPANAVTTCTPTSPAATLASGSSITCTTKLTPSTAGDYAVSVATSNNLYDRDTANNTATTTVKVNTPAALNIVKSLVQVNGAAVPASYATKIGDKLTYAMLVTNTGGTAGTTVLTETVPEGTKFVGGNAPDLTQGWSEVPQKCDAAGTSCEQSVNVPAQTAEGPGEKTVEFTVEVIAPATSNGKITNTVASDIAAACAGNACSVETDNAVADMQAQITSIPAGAVVVGDSVTITGVCTNNGPANAVNASCEMTVNNGGTSIPAICGANANLAVNDSISCSATFTAAEGTISASINAAAQSYESNTANNTDSKSTVGNTAASLVTTNVLTEVNGAAVPANYLAKPGDVLTYTVTVVNSGGTAGSTDVGMTVPAGTTYTGTGQGWGAGCTAAGTQCAQTVPVAANQTSTVTYTVTVASPGTTATIVDTATSSVGTCTTCVVTTNTQQADMVASVTVTPGTTSTTGIELTYTAICKNNGPQAALNASCVVSAPAGASAVVCTPTSPAATLASGDSISCVTKLTPSTAGDYAVSVTTGNTLYDVNTGNNTASTSVKVNTPADLRIVKSLALVNDAAVPANYAAKIGDKLTYAMLVTNAGGTSGTTVLTETVPEGTQFVGGIAPNESQGWSQVTQVCDAAGSTCTQSVTVAAQGADGVASEQTVQFTVEVVAPATTNGKITNTVLSDVAAACAGANCSVETANAVADMQAQITSIPAGAVVVGDSVTITGVCTNNGPANAVNASCEMTVNNGGTSIPAICGANANLAVNDSISCSATFPAAEGTISASINAAAQSYESNTANNTDSKSTVGNTAASLVTTNVLTEVNGAAVPANYLAKPGDVLTYTVTVVNSGGTAGSTDVGMTVPAGTTYTGTGEGWSAGCAAASSTCNQTVAVGAGQTSTVTYTVTVASPGTTATIVDTATSSVGTCTTCVVTTNTQQADMVATVTVTPGTTSTTGIELTYTAICKNNGPQAALNSSCVVSAPAGASAVVCTPTSPAATLASGDSISCVTKLTPSTAGDYAVSVATSNNLYDAAPGNNTATTTVKVNTPAALNIVKSLALVNDAAVPANYAAKIGDKLTYAMLVTNAGGTASTLVLTETVPEGTQFVGTAADPSQGWSQAPACDAAGSTCEQSVTVPAQSAQGAAGEQTVEFTVEVLAPATSNGKIINTVESSIPAACISGACSVETANAVADMQAQITSIPAGAVVVGESLTISGLCTNNGPADAVNASCKMSVNNGGSVITAICDAGKTLAVAESLSCSLTFTAAEGSISASISAETQSYDSDTANNSDAKAVNGNTPSAVTVTNVLVKVNDAPVPVGYVIKPGDKLTYQVQVSNTGGTPGATVLTETVPAGTRYVGTDEGWGAGCAAAASSCSRPATVPGGSPQAPGTVTFEYTVRVDDTVASPNVVNTVGSSAPGSCSAACSVSTPTQAADMQVSMPATIDAKVGVEFTLTSVCRNAGPATATNARCEVSGAPAGAVTACTPAQPVSALAVGESITCTTKFKPTSTAAITISTRASSDVYDPVAANNEATSSALFTNTPPTDVKRVPVNAAWAMALMALLLMLLAGKAMPQRQGRRRQD